MSIGRLKDVAPYAQAFFEDLGFTVERHSLLEVTDKLTSPGKLNIDLDEVVAMNSPASVFVMRAAEK